MQTLPLFKKDLTSLAVHSFKHSSTSKMLSASKPFLKYCFFMRYNAGHSCCCPFPSFNPLLASRHTKNKKKSHYQVYEALLALASSIPLHCLSSGHLHRTSNGPKELYLRTLQLLFLPPGMLVSV